MRLILALGLAIVSFVPASASPPDAASSAPHSPVISWRPQAWHPPVAAMPAAAGLRFEPDNAAAAPISDLDAQAAARRQALANVPVRTRRDGSRYAVIGGLIRSYTVASIGSDGRLVEDCVHSEAQALQIIAAPAGKKE